MTTQSRLVQPDGIAESGRQVTSGAVAFFKMIRLMPCLGGTILPADTEPIRYLHKTPFAAAPEQMKDVPRGKKQSAFKAE